LLPNLAKTHFDTCSFGGFSEPFENPEIVDLIELSAAQRFVGQIAIYSNGELLTPAVVNALRHVPLFRVDVSCHGVDVDIYRRTRRSLDPGKIRDNVAFLLQNRENISELVISVSGPFGPSEALQELRELCVRYGARLEQRQLHSRAGLLRIGRLKEPRQPGPF